MSAALDTYRLRIPAHAAVPDAVVEDWLTEASASHTASALGAQFTAACVYWAASRIEPAVQAGMYPGDGGCTASGDPGDVLASEDTVYWAWYLQIIKTRAAGAPRLVRAC